MKVQVQSSEDAGSCHECRARDVQVNVIELTNIVVRLCASCAMKLGLEIASGCNDSVFGKIRNLPKSVFAAGFRCGYSAGGDDAVAYEWGTRKSTTCEDAWSSDVQWRLDTDGSYRIDPLNPEDWNNIP